MWTQRDLQSQGYPQGQSQALTTQAGEARVRQAGKLGLGRESELLLRVELGK